MSAPTFRAELIDRIVRWRMEAENIEIEDGWLDEHDCLDFDRLRLPPHLLGPVAQMRDNAGSLADSICGLIQRKLGD